MTKNARIYATAFLFNLLERNVAHNHNRHLPAAAAAAAAYLLSFNHKPPLISTAVVFVICCVHM